MHSMSLSFVKGANCSIINNGNFIFKMCQSYAEFILKCHSYIWLRLFLTVNVIIILPSLWLKTNKIPINVREGIYERKYKLTLKPIKYFHHAFLCKKLLYKMMSVKHLPLFRIAKTWIQSLLNIYKIYTQDYLITQCKWERSKG